MKIKCIAYTTERVEKGISPLHSIRVEFEGDEDLVNELKSLLSENLTSSELKSKLDDFTKNNSLNLVDDSAGLLYKNDGKSININFEAVDLLEDLTVEDLLKTMSTSSQTLDINPNLDVTFLQAEDFDNIYNKDVPITSNQRRYGVYVNRDKHIVIRLDDVMGMDFDEQIKELKTFIKTWSKFSTHPIFDRYLDSIRHELLHNLIEDSTQHKDYKNLLTNAVNYTEEQKYIAAHLPEQFKHLALLLKGTPDYRSFLSELFVLIESGYDEVKTLTAPLLKQGIDDFADVEYDEQKQEKKIDEEIHNLDAEEQFNSTIQSGNLEDLFDTEAINLFENKKAYMNFMNIAYKPYQLIDENANNYRSLILSLNYGDIVYIGWDIDGETTNAPQNFLVKKEIIGNNIRLTVKGKKYDAKKKYEDRDFTLKTIYLNFDSEVRNKKAGEKNFVAHVKAFRRFTGRTANLGKSAEITPISKSVKSALLHNAVLWSKSQNNTSTDDKSLPAFKTYSNKTDNKEFTVHLKSDEIGMFFHMDETTNYIDVKNNVITNTTSQTPQFTSANSENLGDATFGLLKPGDIVIYRAAWNDHKKQYTYKYGIVAQKFSEGLTVLDIHNDKDNTSLGDVEIPINRKDLSKAYVFFNSDSKILEKSKLIEDLKMFSNIVMATYKKIKAEELNIDPETIENIQSKAQNLKVFNLATGFDVKKIRHYKYDSKNFEFEDSSTFFSVEKSIIDEVYEGGNFPGPIYNEFKKMYENATEDEKKLIQNDENYENLYTYYATEKNRLNLLKTLKTGSYVLISTPRYIRDENGKYSLALDNVTKKPLRSTNYAFVVAKSKQFLTVATPKKIWTKNADGNPVINFVDGTFDYFEVNVADMRENSNVDLIRIYDNTQFEKSLISILESARSVVGKNYKNDADYVNQILANQNGKDQVDFSDNPAFNDIKGFNDLWVKIMFNEVGFDEETTLSKSDLVQRKAHRDEMIQFLETGSIVYYWRNEWTDKKGNKMAGSKKQFMVIGKDLETSLPILAKIETKEYGKNRETYVRSFIPDINKIIGIGLLNKKIEAKRIEFDGSESTIELNANEPFLEEQVELLKQYYKSQQEFIESKSENELETKIEKLNQERESRGWKNLEGLVVSKIVDIRLKKQKSTIIKTIRLQEYTKKDKNRKSYEDNGYEIVKGSERFGIFKEYGKDLSPFIERNYYLNFNANRSDNDKKNEWETPAGLAIIGDIRKGTILTIRDSSKYHSDYISGIVVGKDNMKLTLIRLKDDIKVDDLEALDYDDIEYTYLYYKTANFGTKSDPIYRLVLPNIRSIEFVNGVESSVFERLKNTRDVWKKGNYITKDTGRQNAVISDDVMNISIALKDKNFTTKQFTYSKGGIANTQRTKNINELQKYQDKFSKMYGIKFRLLSTEEIHEEFDNKDEFNNGIISSYNAFKTGNTIVINVDNATLQEPFHEMSHFIIEALRTDDPKLYESLISATKNHTLQNQIKSRYPELSGAQLDEEIFSTVLGLVYSERPKTEEIQDWEDKNQSLLSLLFDWLRKLFRRLGKTNTNISNAEMQKHSVKDILYQFGEDLESGKYQNLIENHKDVKKPGVSELFESNPELANAVYEILGFKADIDDNFNIIKNTTLYPDELKEGTNTYEIHPQQKQQAQQLYSQYLDTVFPNSKVKDILWHSSSNPNIEEFDFKYFGTNSDKGMFGIATYLEANRQDSMPYNRTNKGKTYGVIVNIQNPARFNEITDYISLDESDKSIQSKKDLLHKNNDSAILGNWQYAIFNNDNTRILGSKQDIQGFKDYVLKSQNINPIKNNNIAIENLKKDLLNNNNLNMYCI